MKHRQFTTELRTIFLRALEQDFAESGIRFALPKTGEEHGIHLKSPEVWEIAAAVKQALAEGYETIYIN